MRSSAGLPPGMPGDQLPRHSLSSIPVRSISRAVPPPARPRREFAPGGLARLSARTRELVEAGADTDLAARLKQVLLDGDDRDLARLCPYALAGAWGAPRRRVLETCLLAVRAGLLDFRWDLLCPSCRGTNAVASRLREVRSPVPS